MTQRLRDNQALLTSVYGIIAASDHYTKLDRFGDRVEARKTLARDVINAVDRALTATGPVSGECCTFPSCACVDPASCDRPSAPGEPVTGVASSWPGESPDGSRGTPLGEVDTEGRVWESRSMARRYAALHGEDPPKFPPVGSRGTR